MGFGQSLILRYISTCSKKERKYNVQFYKINSFTTLQNTLYTQNIYKHSLILVYKHLYHKKRANL